MSFRVRWATPDEIKNWDDLITKNPIEGDLLNSRVYTDSKAIVGWTPKYAIVEKDGEFYSAESFLEQWFPVVGRYWYFCRGVNTPSVAELEGVVTALRDFAKARRGVFAITLEPMMYSSEQRDADLHTYAQSTPYIQTTEPRHNNSHTVVVDIDKSDDEILASFNKKNRNMVRRAMRDGVEVREYPANQETFDHMHRLMRLVGGGKGGLLLRSKKYQEAMWRGFSATGQGRFYGIDVDGSPAVLAYMIRVGRKAAYKDGGSERPRTSPGMANLLQYEAMRRMRDEGATTYDLFGIAPKWAQSNDDHPSYELGRFKLSFADRTDYVDRVNVILKPQMWKLWRKIGERVAAKVHRHLRKDVSLY